MSLTAEDKRDLLARVTVFSGFAPRELEALVPAARAETFKAREEVFHKGDPGAQLYVVVSGRLKALTTSMDGDDVVFNIMGPREVFGEIALLSEGPRTATVRAIDECELLVLDRRDFLTFLKKTPDAAVQMLSVLAERIKRASELVEDTQFLNLPVRLAKKFTSIAESYGRTDGDVVRIDLRLSQEEWGDLVGATRESINKQMRIWSEEGLIQVEGGMVTILQPAVLERLGNLSIV